MRRRAKNGEISIHAIAGSHVVLLGLDATPSTASKFLEINILRKGPGERESQPLSDSV
jgi:hypothetical protein